MNKRSLGALAIVLILLMAFVAMAGLDDLPRNLRASAESAVTQLASAKQSFETDRAAVRQALTSEPELFAGVAAAWQERLDKSAAQLAAADSHVTRLRQLAEVNRREDREAVEREIRELQQARDQAARQAGDIRKQAERWVQAKRNMPQTLSAMERDYQAVQTFDVESAAAAARKAGTEWPAKQSDLAKRIDALTENKAAAMRAFENTAASRSAAQAANWSAVDYSALIAAADRLAGAPQQLREAAEGINSLAGQLYVSWDKLLLEAPENGQARVRVVSTKYPDASLQNGQVSQAERTETVAGNTRDLERAEGMVIQRKPAGKYDSEAESVLQPPAYAYVAPPGQRNQYGSWNNGVWNWLPQYLILSQILRGTSYPPISTGDWRDYNDYRRRGETYYGGAGRAGTRASRSTGGGLRRALEGLSGDSGSSSTASSGRRRETWTWGGKGGGAFGGSRYQSRGTFGGSRYQSRSGGGFGSRSYSRGFGGRSFGRGGRR